MSGEMSNGNNGDEMSSFEERREMLTIDDDWMVNGCWVIG